MEWEAARGATVQRKESHVEPLRTVCPTGFPTLSTTEPLPSLTWTNTTACTSCWLFASQLSPAVAVRGWNLHLVQLILYDFSPGPSNQEKVSWDAWGWSGGVAPYRGNISEHSQIRPFPPFSDPLRPEFQSGEIPGLWAVSRHPCTRPALGFLCVSWWCGPRDMRPLSYKGIATSLPRPDSHLLAVVRPPAGQGSWESCRDAGKENCPVEKGKVFPKATALTQA